MTFVKNHLSGRVRAHRRVEELHAADGGAAERRGAVRGAGPRVPRSTWAHARARGPHARHPARTGSPPS